MRRLRKLGFLTFFLNSLISNNIFIKNCGFMCRFWHHDCRGKTGSHSTSGIMRLVKKKANRNEQ